jgi:hypothetical protein
VVVVVAVVVLLVAAGFPTLEIAEYDSVRERRVSPNQGIARQ